MIYFEKRFSAKTGLSPRYNEPRFLEKMYRKLNNYIKLSKKFDSLFRTNEQITVK